MKRDRRWFQYRFGTLFLVMLVFGAGLGMIVKKAKDQRRAVLAIQRLDGVVQYGKASNTTDQPTGSHRAVFHRSPVLPRGRSSSKNEPHSQSKIRNLLARLENHC